MKFRDTLAMGLRSLKERPLETGLIILGIALSACVASGSLLLLGSQRAQTERLLQGPAFREIVVQPENGNGPESSAALREINQATEDRVSFSNEDVDNILNSVPQVRYSYKASNNNIRVSGFGGGQGGFMIQAANPAGNPATTGSPSPSAPPESGTSASPAPQASPEAAAGDPASAGIAVTMNGKGKVKVVKDKKAAASPEAPADQGASAATPDAIVPLGQTAPAAPQDLGAPAALPEMGLPGGTPFRDQPQAELSAGETLLMAELTEFRAMAVSPEFFQAYGVQTAYGVLFTDTETQGNAAAVVLGQDLAAKLFPAEKAQSLVGRKVRLENRLWSIAGILDEASGKVELSNGTALGDMAFAPAADFVIRNGNQVIRINRGNSSLRFAVGGTADLAPAYEALNAYFEKTYGIGKVRITVPFDEARLSRDGFDRLLWLIVAFGTGALLMALINLMNMMLTRALRRQAILGILGAMGASQLDLTKLQTVEGGLMASGGSLLGIGLSIPFYGVLYSAGKNLFGISGGQAPLDPMVLALTAPLILLVGLVLALIPVWQSSNTPITTALRSE
jgi:hypothetical protein